MNKVLSCSIFEFAAFAPGPVVDREIGCLRSFAVIVVPICVKRVTILAGGVSLRRIKVKTRIFGGLTVALGLVAAALPVLAHHSFAAEFDGNKKITLAGVVTKMDWVNPHAYIYVDVKDDDGGVVNWAIETGAPNVLYRQGWRKDDLKAGDAVTVEAFLAKDGSHTAAAWNVKLPDGRKVFAGTPNSTPDQK
jgi:Family of unknown function (DUF6152)